MDNLKFGGVRVAWLTHSPIIHQSMCLLHNVTTVSDQCFLARLVLVAFATLRLCFFAGRPADGSRLFDLVSPSPLRASAVG